MAEAPLWLPSSASSIGAVAHHDYGFANDDLSVALGDEMRLLSGNKQTWFTEICCYVPATLGQGDPRGSLSYGQGFEYGSLHLPMAYRTHFGGFVARQWLEHFSWLI